MIVFLITLLSVLSIKYIIDSTNDRAKSNRIIQQKVKKVMGQK